MTRSSESFGVFIWPLCRNSPNGSKRILQVCGLYIWLPPAILELLETWDTSYTLKNNSKPFKEQIDHILRFSTCFVSVSARLALEWVSEQGCVPCALVLEENHILYSVCRPLGVLVARRQCHRPSGLVWSGDDIFVRGTWRPPPFLVKLLSGKRDQGVRDCVHGRELIAGSNTLCECFNNVDVGAPLWQFEPRNKSSCWEFASSHPSL